MRKIYVYRRTEIKTGRSKVVAKKYTSRQEFLVALVKLNASEKGKATYWEVGYGN